MTTFYLKKKLFFDYGIVSQDIQKYAKANNMGMKDAYSALKQQRASAGIGQEAFRAGDKSLFKADSLTAAKNSTGVVGKSAGGAFTTAGKASATAASAAGTQFNKGYNAAMKTMPKQTPATFKGAWGNMSKMGKAGVIGGAALLGGLAIKGLMSGKKKED